MRFMLLTLCRRDEACDARWRDVNLERRVWTIPQPKNTRPHRRSTQPHEVPLSVQAVQLLSSLMPESPNLDSLVFATSAGGTLTNWDRETRTLQRASETSAWHRHDLRRTSATLLGEMGEMPHVVEAALGHASVLSAIASVYNRARYQPEVATALQRLADALDGIEVGSATVVPMLARLSAARS
jgi:integrase